LAVDATGNGFAYTGSLRWSVEDGVLTPESMAITDGRAVCDSTNMWSANYYITDHLGSVRAVTNAEGEVLDTFDYMPYGSEFTTDTDNITDYRFTGKERQSMVNNSIYDSFARFQNTYGRFMSIDPKAESFYHISPYTYCAGDPVNLVDPDGMDIYRFDKDTGEFICEEYTDDKFDQIGKYKYEDGKYVLERKSNGKPKLLVSRVAKGILFPGANFKENQGEFIIGGTHGLTEQEFQLFVFELSYLSEVELSGYYFANKGETSTSYILMGKYKRNTRTESFKPIIDYKKINLYDPVASWHTHPENIGPSRQDFDSAEEDYKYHPTIKRHFIIARDEYNQYWYIPY
jgi:RHS repeat-associated protein